MKSKVKKNTTTQDCSTNVQLFTSYSVSKRNIRKINYLTDSNVTLADLLRKDNEAIPLLEDV